MVYEDHNSGKAGERKGQSAIEYLTTYGWMLLVIAIVGGAIFTTVQGQTQLQTSSGFANADIRIENWGVTGQGLQVELRNAAQDQADNVQITVYSDNSSFSQSATAGTIPVGQTETVTLGDFENDETEDNHDVTITHDIGNLDGLTQNGTIRGTLQYNP